MFTIMLSSNGIANDGNSGTVCEGNALDDRESGVPLHLCVYCIECKRPHWTQERCDQSSYEDCSGRAWGKCDGESGEQTFAFGFHYSTRTYGWNVASKTQYKCRKVLISMGKVVERR